MIDNDKFRLELLRDDDEDFNESLDGLDDDDLDDFDELPDETLDYTYRDDVDDQPDLKIVDGESYEEGYFENEEDRSSGKNYVLRNPHNSSEVVDAHGDFDEYRANSRNIDFEDEDSDEYYQPENIEEDLIDESKNEPKYIPKYEVPSAFEMDSRGEARFVLDNVINYAIDAGASDIFIQPNKHIWLNILGENYEIPEFGLIDDIDVRDTMNLKLNSVLTSEFIETKELDTSYVVESGPHRGRRLRLNVAVSFGHRIMTFRIIDNTIPRIEDIGLEQEIVDWSDNVSGVFMMCGRTGTGKTTTIASIIDNIRRNSRKHILTIEKPIEFVYPEEGKSLVTQREVITDTKSFSNAMDSAMRMKPDVILVGEVRNAIEVDQLIRASESGHLSISTMHTKTPHGTIQRIASLYSEDDRRRIMASLGEVAIGFANQLLLPTVDGKSRFALREILTVNNEVRDYIYQGKTFPIKDYQVRRKATMEHKLVKSFQEGRCTREVAYSNADDKELFRSIEQGKY